MNFTVFLTRDNIASEWIASEVIDTGPSSRGAEIRNTMEYYNETWGKEEDFWTYIAITTMRNGQSESPALD